MADQDVQTMRAAYEAFNRGDIPAVLSAFDPAIEWHEPGGGQAPRGVYEGAERVANEVFSQVSAHFERFEAAPEQFIDAGEHLVVVGRFRGRAKSGRELDAPFAHVWAMRGGKATRFHNHPAAAPWATAWSG